MKTKTDYLKRLKLAFKGQDTPVDIPDLKSGSFKAELVKDGIKVSNLGTAPFLPWDVFEVTINLLVEKKGKTLKGDAMGARLGGKELSLDSIEGIVAQKVYGKKKGESVFRRITPIINILMWSGICKKKRGRIVELVS